MTETCDRWSIALEQERQGELSGDERRALEEHLAGCERCRAEERAIASIAYELSSSAPSPLPPPRRGGGGGVGRAGGGGGGAAGGARGWVLLRSPLGRCNRGRAG